MPARHARAASALAETNQWKLQESEPTDSTTITVYVCMIATWKI